MTAARSWHAGDGYAEALALRAALGPVERRLTAQHRVHGVSAIGEVGEPLTTPRTPFTGYLSTVPGAGAAEDQRLGLYDDRPPSTLGTSSLSPSPWCSQHIHTSPPRVQNPNGASDAPHTKHGCDRGSNGAGSEGMGWCGVLGQGGEG